jgi:hypothetical protein
MLNLPNYFYAIDLVYHKLSCYTNQTLLISLHWGSQMSNFVFL